ncbi:hypothetical protein MKX08_000124 [Trichoderma sp. CBMAI-0020]|nr:hypothetical protein MKX08_000124 [Trichoderma sp. CBMAI-0020]
MAIDNVERHGQRGDYSCDLAHAVQTTATTDFFDAIAHGEEGRVRNFIEQCPEICDAPNEHGETPLIAAVRADKPVIVRDLLWNGAKVNALANYTQQGQNSPASRTALQVAAAEGKLHMIRILRENRADVFLNAPDEVNALQLAAGNGHQSVVEHIQRAYAGAIRRSPVAPADSTPDDLANTKIHPVDRQEPVKHVSAQCVQMRNGKNSEFIIWAVRRFVLDKTPPTVISAKKNVLEDKPKGTSLFGENMKLWCQGQIKKLPTGVQKGIDLVDRGTRDALGLVTKAPAGTLQLMKRAPNALWTIMLCIGTMLRKLGLVAPYLLGQMTAVVQAIAKAIASIRAATLYSIKTVLSTIHSVFKEIPKMLVALVARLRQTSCAMLQAGIGSLNKVVMIFAALALGVCILFSKRAWGVLRAPTEIAKKGVREMLGLMGPRKM